MADYTYASARVKALESALLSSSQIELLVSAKGSDELYSTLYDTYLASYLKRNTEQDILAAIEEQVSETKELLISIVPVPTVLDVLWVKYDYHNLMVIVKGTRTGTSDEEILRQCYQQGTVEPRLLLSYVRSETLSSCEPELAAVYRIALEAKVAGAVDELCNTSYFDRALHIATVHRDSFAIAYVQALIDLFNVKALARSELRETFRLRHPLVSGGVCPILDTLDPAHVARTYACYGGEDRWKAVVRGVTEGEPVATLEKLADESFSDWLRMQALYEFGLASIFSYFHAVKNNAQIISAISKAKRANMSEKDLRSILRIRTNNIKRL
ncbi:MAG: V-type ATPase subunit [Candidatus Pacebacteria bacterium]|nr:V-type ATPase subunit [Candidatus Paceibacterota bacterium]